MWRLFIIAESRRRIVLQRMRVVVYEHMLSV